jgi:hypothetical protein
MTNAVLKLIPLLQLISQRAQMHGKQTGFDFV